jgi:hypothetical protein
MAKRVRVPDPKPGVLEARWGRADSFNKPSVVYVHGGGGSVKADARLLSTMFEGRDVDTGSLVFGRTGKSLIKELEDRGYDITTLKFSIRLKEQP